MRELLGKEGEKRLSKIGMERMLVSMGYQSCGAVTLWNYPTWIRNLIAHDINGEDRPDPVDMAAIEGKLYFHFILCNILKVESILLLSSTEN